MRVFVLPIEPVEGRYSGQWLRWFPEELTRLDVDNVTLLGLSITDRIEQGEFLDVVNTNYWKATQLTTFVNALRLGHVRDGDWVLVLDGWNPAVQQLAYMRDLGSVKFRIATCWHAGSYDPWDLLGQHPTLKEWARHAEKAMLAASDLAFVATGLHASLLANTRGYGAKVRVTGFPLRPDEWIGQAEVWDLRPRRVVFPHRLAPEKNPAEWEQLRADYAFAYPEDDVQWVRTRDICATKDDYYRVLGDSRVAVSTAFQETWGIAMLEASSLGCHPVVPDRLSYQDVYDRHHRYLNREDAVRMIRAGLDAQEPHRHDNSRWDAAIGNMVALMKEYT